MNPENKNRLQWKLDRLKNARPIEKLKALEDQISNILSLVGMYSDKNKDDYYKTELNELLLNYLSYICMEKDITINKDLIQRSLTALQKDTGNSTNISSASDRINNKEKRKTCLRNISQYTEDLNNSVSSAQERSDKRKLLIEELIKYFKIKNISKFDIFNINNKDLLNNINLEEVTTIGDALRSIFEDKNDIHKVALKDLEGELNNLNQK